MTAVDKDPFVRRAAGVAAAVVCAVLALASCTSSPTPVSSGDGQGFISGGGTATVVDPQDRSAAPNIEGVTLDGDRLSLSDFGDDVVVLNVWGSWCGPCRAEAPTLREVSQDNKAKGVSFLGLNTKDQDASAVAFERQFDIDYPSLVDSDGQLQLEFKDTLPPLAIPSTLIIDRQGRVAARVLGETTYNQLSELVDGVLAEGT